MVIMCRCTVGIRRCVTVSEPAQRVPEMKLKASGKTLAAMDLLLRRTPSVLAQFL